MHGELIYLDLRIGLLYNISKSKVRFQDLSGLSPLVKIYQKTELANLKKKSQKKSKQKTQSLTHYSIIALMRGSHGLSAQRA